MFQVLYRSSVGLAALAASSTAFAEDAPAHAVAADADSITVTATRAPPVLDEIPSSVAVLDKEAIDRAPEIGVTELLPHTPGTSMSRNGGYGTSPSLRTHAAESDHPVRVPQGLHPTDPSPTEGGFTS